MLLNDLNIKDDLLTALNEFYEQHIVETVDKSLQVFRSFTYGEMVISFILLLILFTMIFKWFWEVLR